MFKGADSMLGAHVPTHNICADKEKVPNCILHQVSSCEGTYFDNGECQVCDDGYELSSDKKTCTKCQDTIPDCLRHLQNVCGTCQVCDLGSELSSDEKTCTKCQHERVSKCFSHKTHKCGGLDFDNGRCEVCDLGYERSNDWRTCTKVTWW